MGNKKLRRDDEVLVRTLDSGKEKIVELIKVARSLESPFEPEKVSHFNVTKVLTDKGLALKRGTRQRVSQNLNNTSVTSKPRNVEKPEHDNISILQNDDLCDP